MNLGNLVGNFRDNFSEKTDRRAEIRTAMDRRLYNRASPKMRMFALIAASVLFAGLALFISMS